MCACYVYCMCGMYVVCIALGQKLSSLDQTQVHSHLSVICQRMLLISIKLWFSTVLPQGLVVFSHVYILIEVGVSFLQIDHKAHFTKSHVVWANLNLIMQLKIIFWVSSDRCL